MLSVDPGEALLTPEGWKEEEGRGSVFLCFFLSFS